MPEAKRRSLPNQCLSIMTFEGNTIGSKQIQIRGFNVGTTDQGKTIAPPLICSYKKNIHTPGL
jgi:hypothetical protein